MKNHWTQKQKQKQNYDEYFYLNPNPDLSNEKLIPYLTRLSKNLIEATRIKKDLEDGYSVELVAYALGKVDEFDPDKNIVFNKFFSIMNKHLRTMIKRDKEVVKFTGKFQEASNNHNGRMYP